MKDDNHLQRVASLTYELKLWILVWKRFITMPKCQTEQGLKRDGHISEEGSQLKRLRIRCSNEGVRPRIERHRSSSSRQVLLQVRSSSQKGGSSFKTKKAKTPINDKTISITFSTTQVLDFCNVNDHAIISKELLKRRSTRQAMIPENKPSNVIFQRGNHF